MTLTRSTVVVLLFRGLVACIIVFILLCVTVTPNGPFRRPHPALWRLTFSLSILYQLALIFVLFQVVLLFGLVFFLRL